MLKKIITTLFLGGCISAVFWDQIMQQEDHQAPSKKLLSFVKVKTLNIEDKVTATGIIKPQVGSKVRIGSQVSGVLEELLVNVGDTVHKGQLLARLQEDEFLARRDRAQAQLEVALANKVFAEDNFEREVRLGEKNLTPKIKRQTTKHELNLARARYKLAQSDLKLAQINLDRTQISASLNGVVESISTREGETVTASFAAPTFLTIIDLERLEVWAYVDETDIGRIKVGQQVTFTVDTYPDATYSGTITAIRPQAVIEDNVVNYIAVIQYDETDNYILRPEMTAFINVSINKSESVSVLPQKALMSEEGQKLVWVQRNGELQKHNIQIGKRFGTQVEVIQGLEANDRVAIPLNDGEG